jgi:hypothetical protein
VACGHCGHLLLFDAETIGIRGRGRRGGTCSVRVTGGVHETRKGRDPAKLGSRPGLA